MPKLTRATWLLPLLLLLSGCNTVVLNPSGDIARQQGDLIVVATLLMLIVIIPVIALTGDAMRDFRSRMLEAGFIDHVEKPVTDFMAFVGTIRKHLGPGS